MSLSTKSDTKKNTQNYTKKDRIFAEELHKAVILIESLNKELKIHTYGRSDKDKKKMSGSQA